VKQGDIYGPHEELCPCGPCLRGSLDRDRRKRMAEALEAVQRTPYHRRVSRRLLLAHATPCTLYTWRYNGVEGFLLADVLDDV